MSKAAAPDTQVRSTDFPLVDRCMELRQFKRVATRDAGGDGEGDDGNEPLPPLATAELVFTTGAPVLRYDWSNGRYYMEELVVEEGAIRLDRLTNGAPLLNSHDSWDLEAVLGVVDSPAIADGAGTCGVTFSRRESVEGYVQDVADRVIRNVSVGYVRHAMEMIAPSEEAGVWRYRVTDWEPYEVSLVPIPADAGAQVRSADGKPPQIPEGRASRTFPCQVKEVSPTVGTTAATQTRKDVTMTPEEQAAAAAEAAKKASAEAAAAAATAERQRAADITDICTRASIPAEKMSKFIADGTAVEEVRKQVLDELVKRDAGGERNVTRVYTVNDETKTRLAGIEEAIEHRVSPKAKLTDNGRQFRGMRLMEIGREHLERSNINTRGMSPMQLATLIMQHRSGGMLSTSDFANLLANVANKRLRQAYEENMPSYQRWARRAPDAPDFKSMSVVNLAGAPDLLQVNEHGEFKYGAMTDGKETYSLLTYGRIVSLTRQALINDDLRGFDRLVGAFGNSAARLENRTVYSILTTNAALSDTVALFHASHSNLAGAGGAISVTTLGAGRKSMRLQKGLQSEELNLAPRYLIVPATQEALAYQYTSANYTPTQPAQINEFAAGGRTALEPIVEAVLDANSTTAWYLAADNGQIDTVEYCYLEGAAGPMVESEVGFEVDGINYKARLDFAAKAIDFRGLYKDPGA
jgi:hypothetical protein